ncbi:MAG: hypothetical protein ABFC84_16615 [Veillonellales bacterium]
MGRPTAKQIEFATELLQQLGYDPDDYDFSSMDFQEVSKLIDELKDERGY